MCLAVPAQIIEIVDKLATVELSGITRKVSIMLLPEAKVGDFVLIHAGFAIQTVDQEEADYLTDMLRELNIIGQ